METAARMARAGNKMLTLFAALLIILMFAYGGYSLWDTAMIYQGAFVSSDLMAFKPSVNGTEEGNPTLSELQAINEDVRGWLTIDDTHIDYPVVQGENDLTYINKDVYGEFSLSGSIFLSCLNSPDFSDAYNLVYGHHMDNGGMFGDIVEFTDADYFDSHTTGTLYLPETTYSITIFACVECDAYDTVFYRPDLQTNGDIVDLLDYIGNNAVQYRDIGMTSDDIVIGLSTCSDAETNGRVIVFGRLDKIN